MNDFTPYSIGVDGGGTKTLAIIVDADGNERGRGYAGSANHTHAGSKQAVENIHAAVTRAAQQANCTLPLQSAWFGLAGIDRPEDCDLLLPYLQPLAQHINLTNDAELVLSGLPDAIGMALIAGTGSIALGRDARGVSARTGGWGHLIGDEGSGYHLGRRCLQAVAKAADGRGPATALVELVLKQWQLGNTDDIIGKVYNDCDQAGIAALSSLVCSAARDGDTVAYSIIEDAAYELVLTLAALQKRLDFVGKPIPLALSGGLLLHEDSFREQVIRATATQLSVGTITLVEEPALSGARAALFSKRIL